MKVVTRPASMNYEVAGRLLSVEVSDEHLNRIVAELCEGWSIRPVSSDQQSPDAKIRLLLEPDLPAIPQGWTRFEIAEGGWCHTDGDSYYVALPDSLVLVHALPVRQVTVWLRKFLELPNAQLSHYVSFAVCSVLRRCNVFELHSAAVVPPDSEHATLLIGPSGSGKSTLSFNLIKSGWNYLSDDELLLERVGDMVQAQAFRRFFAITKSLQPAFGGPGRQGTNETEVKTCFYPSTLYPVRELEKSVPDRIVFLSITGEEKTRLVELTSLESMSRLIRSCPWATYDRAVAQNHLLLLSQLARQSRSFELYAGTDMLHPQNASSLFSELSRS